MSLPATLVEYVVVQRHPNETHSQHRISKNNLFEPFHSYAAM